MNIISYIKFKIRKVVYTSIVLMFFLGCDNNSSTKKEINNSQKNSEKKNEILYKHLKNGAWKYDLYSKEWQTEIDKGLAKDSTIAYLWQQKAMPLFKQAKYEVGMKFIDKAVKYDRIRWQDYRAYIKCIFAKTYKDAVNDFEDCKKRFGNNYVMDHTYNFYIGLCYLQLNQFKKALHIFEKDYNETLKDKGENWIHHLDLFYYGISKYEIGDYNGAILLFDKALKLYPQFSDVLYYKSKCLEKLNKLTEANKIIKIAEDYAQKGYSINESGSPYERFPYQVRW
ncbi:tetratricopeptide repeat protein [Tenacibaculum geojense]|uniref:Tetratricopeptide repeat protein n=1 Tax=Tenacibaculum geojense TaxID=915352 RepID=A0ABW3JTC3_9FLAO